MTQLSRRMVLNTLAAAGAAGKFASISRAHSNEVTSGDRGPYGVQDRPDVTIVNNRSEAKIAAITLRAHHGAEVFHTETTLSGARNLGDELPAAPFKTNFNFPKVQDERLKLQLYVDGELQRDIPIYIGENGLPGYVNYYIDLRENESRVAYSVV